MGAETEAGFPNSTNMLMPMVTLTRTKNLLAVTYLPSPEGGLHGARKSSQRQLYQQRRRNMSQQRIRQNKCCGTVTCLKNSASHSPKSQSYGWTTKQLSRSCT